MKFRSLFLVLFFCAAGLLSAKNFSVDAGGPITDPSGINPTATTTYTFTISDNFNIGYLSLRLALGHEEYSDIGIHLKSPAGTDLLIFDSGHFPGSDVQFRDANFADNGTFAFESVNPNPGESAIYGNSFRLETTNPKNFAIFNNEQVNGTWQLLVTDFSHTQTR